MTSTATLNVSNLKNSVKWYKRVLGNGPDLRFRGKKASWLLADDIVFELVETEGPVRTSTVNFVEADLASRLMELNLEGLAVEGHVMGRELVRLSIADPDGNRLIFAPRARRFFPPIAARPDSDKVANAQRRQA